MYSLEAANGFLKKAHKFFRRHPDLRSNFAKVAEALKQDPFQPVLKLHQLSNAADRRHPCMADRFQPVLKLHQLSNRMKGVYAVSLTFIYRITLTLKITEKTIILLDIGSHDDVYR